MPRSRKSHKTEYVSPEEAERRRTAFYRHMFAEGTEFLDHLATVLRRDYTATWQYPPADRDLFTEPEVKPVDDLDWNLAYNWQMGYKIGPVGCRLCLRAKNGGPPIVIAHRKRCLRGDPPEDVDHLADEMDASRLPQVIYSLDDDEGDDEQAPKELVSVPAEEVPDRDLLEFCVASRTYLGKPVLVPEKFSVGERARAIRVLKQELRLCTEQELRLCAEDAGSTVPLEKEIK